MGTRRRLTSAICAVFCLLVWGSFGNDRAAASWWAAPADVPGRWVVLSHSYCVLSFAGAPDIPHGTITATGFCPWLFLARPRWQFDEAGQVVITNRHGDVLAVLAVGRGRLYGQIATGEPVSLAR